MKNKSNEVVRLAQAIEFLEAVKVTDYELFEFYSALKPIP